MDRAVRAQQRNARRVELNQHQERLRHLQLENENLLVLNRNYQTEIAHLTAAHANAVAENINLNDVIRELENKNNQLALNYSGNLEILQNIRRERDVTMRNCAWWRVCSYCLFIILMIIVSVGLYHVFWQNSEPEIIEKPMLQQEPKKPEKDVTVHLEEPSRIKYEEDVPVTTKPEQPGQVRDVEHVPEHETAGSCEGPQDLYDTPIKNHQCVKRTVRTTFTRTTLFKRPPPA